ncbi:MAG TPA: sugar ABC transporter permease [Chthoniobacterales bacterium]|nr:sugar ABC transporter permease [Chthoniobacterales bacterium]
MNPNLKTPPIKGAKTEIAERTWPVARRFRLEASPYLFILPFVVFCLLLMFYPVVYSFTLSFRQATVETFVSGEMPFNGLTQYQAAVADPVFWRAVVNTVLFAFFSILFQFTIGFFLALLFQVDFPCKNFCLAILLIPWVLPVLTAANIFKGLFNDIGPINQIFHTVGLGPFPWLAEPAYAFPATIVANIWIGFPFNFILLYAGMRSIPVELYEAAKIDGANSWKRMAHITVPMLKPVSAAVLMLGTIYTVKVFDLVWVMTGGGPANGTQLLSTYAYQVGFSLLNFGEAAAIATLMVLLVLLLNLVQMVLQRN